MKSIIIVYDDSIAPSKEIKNITGGKSFGNTIFKRMTLSDRIKEMFEGIQEVMGIYDDPSVMPSISGIKDQPCVVHLFSMFGIHDPQAFYTLLEKARYVQLPYQITCNQKVAMAIFPNAECYREYVCRKTDNVSLQEQFMEFAQIESDAFFDLSNMEGFLQFITGGFDARFFNALQGDDFTVTKSSSNQMKIKAEYEFYRLLPDYMKMWFVMPFSYKQEQDSASYTMERYHMTDIAIRYVHGAIGLEEFKDILYKLFMFIRIRKEKEVSDTEYDENARNLYVAKVEERILQLREKALYPKLNAFLAAGTKYPNIESVIEEYKMLYYRVVTGKTFRSVLVTGHGDLCFSNILYQKDASILKLIDPKGALTEEELYMNPYYDIAKLSHSICGNYDFFNSGLYQITMEDDLQFKLSVDYDNQEYKKLFRSMLEENGYDYRLVRLYETSLFLSMLPLHIDQEKKVFAFLLNALMIMEELKSGK